MSMTFLWSHLWDSAFPGVALTSSLPHPSAWASQDPGCKHASRWQPERCAPTWTWSSSNLLYRLCIHCASPAKVQLLSREASSCCALYNTACQPLAPRSYPVVSKLLVQPLGLLPPEKFSAFSQYKIINTTRFLGLQHVPCWILWEAEAADSPSGRRAVRCVWNNKRGEKRETGEESRALLRTRLSKQGLYHKTGLIKKEKNIKVRVVPENKKGANLKELRGSQQQQTSRHTCCVGLCIAPEAHS